MHPVTSLSRLALAATALLLASCTFAITPEATPTSDGPTDSVTAQATLSTGTPDGARRRVTEVELLNVITISNDAMAFDTVVGGLSAISHDPVSETYYFLSDDRAIFGPARIYQATIDLSDGSLDEGDLTWTGIIPLMDESGAPFAAGLIDPEGLVYTGESFFVASEGNPGVQPPLAPAILEFTPTGEYVASLPLPEKFLPNVEGTRGVRKNKAFESLALTPNGRYLISGVENALLQDGPAATLDDESLSRLLKIDLQGAASMTEPVTSEPVYIVDPIPVAPEPADGEADNGLAELIALDNNGTLLALERSYAEGVGNTVRLNLAATQGAMDVSAFDALTVEGDEDTTYEMEPPVAKELLVDFGELGSAIGVAPDNLEGMDLGPQLADGRQLLLVVSDNNFNDIQTTQLWALALTIASDSAASPAAP